MREFKQEQHTYIETFFSLEDLYGWVLDLISKYDMDEWEYSEAVTDLGGGYRVGIRLVRRQGELFERNSD